MTAPGDSQHASLQTPCCASSSILQNETTVLQQQQHDATSTIKIPWTTTTTAEQADDEERKETTTTSELLLDDDDDDKDDEDDEAQFKSNENALNVAFVSFLTFATVQLFFAIFYAKSQSLMTDCAAMYVDVLSYVVNFWAERLKHGPTKLSPRQVRLQRLYLELIPPFLSVVTLVAVTVLALQTAIETLIHEAQAEATRNKGLDNNDDKDDDNDEDPDLSIMMAFSGLNLILDLVNVGYFVKADQAIGIGLPHQHGEQLVHVEYENKLSSRHSKNNQQDHLHIHHDDASSQNHCHCHQNEQLQEHATEETPLVIVRQDHFVAMTDKEDIESFESPTECESEGASIGRNLNMCSAWTHVCADTLRSVAVLVAAALGALFPTALSPTQVDSSAAILVSIIILMSLGPLLQGLYFTACKIHAIWMGQHDHCQQQ